MTGPLASDAMKMMFSGQEECFFAQSPRDCLKTHEDAIVACGRNSTLCYIPSENKWYKLADMLSIGSNFSHNVNTCHRKLYSIGGASSGNPAERYDPSINTWSPLESFKQRIKFCTVLTFQGLLYIIGGVDEQDNVRLSTVQRYNPDTNLWQHLASLSSPRSTVCAVAYESYLYAIGGNSDSGAVDTVERLDPKKKVWCMLASTVEKRVGACGATVNQKVFVFGGLRKDAYLHSSFSEMYDPATNTWSSITSTVTPRSDYVTTASFKGKIFVCADVEQDDSQANLSLHIYNVVTSEWTYCTSFPLVYQESNEKFKISCLRIPKEVLCKCSLLS